MAVARTTSESIPAGEHAVNDAEVRLRNAAITLFAEKGYSETSVREIIERAGVTRPVLYYYFENKEALFTRLVEAEFAEACAEIDGILDTVSGCRERLAALVMRGFRRAQQSPETVRMLVQFFFAPPIEGLHLDKEKLGAERFVRIVRIMREGIEQGALGESEPEFLALAFSGLMDMHIMAAIGNPEIALTEVQAARLVELFFGGAKHTNMGSENSSS